MAKPSKILYRKRIEVQMQRIRAAREKIEQIQNECPHTEVKSERTAVGFNGYSTDYTTSCHCEICGRSWYHDGYCSGTGHAQRTPTERNA